MASASACVEPADIFINASAKITFPLAFRIMAMNNISIIAAIIRNARGKVILAETLMKTSAGSTQAEAEAIDLGLRLMHELKGTEFDKFSVQTDSSNVAKYINQNKTQNKTLTKSMETQINSILGLLGELSGVVIYRSRYDVRLAHKLVAASWVQWNELMNETPKENGIIANERFESEKKLIDWAPGIIHILREDRRKPQDQRPESGRGRRGGLQWESAKHRAAMKENSKAETGVIRSELADVRNELGPWEKPLSSAEKHLTKKHEGARAAYEDAQKQIDETKRSIETKTSSVKDIQNKLEKLRFEASDARKKEKACLEEQERLIPLEQAARQKVMELSSIMESEKNQGSALKAILQAKEANLIQGIYGRLGDLGDIDGKYDVAISTACAGLYDIVVENTAVAQACVELLRKQNLGVATFMILEKQSNHLPRITEKIVTPEGVPRLFDLIKVQDERMKLAFYAAIGNTIVAKDIDQATRIAYGGKKESWRVVTSDGTMTGEGNRPRGGKMGTSIRASVSGEAMTNAEKELSDLVERLSVVTKNLSDAVKSYKESEKAISPLEMEVAKCQKEIESLKLLLVDLDKQLYSHQSQ